MTPQDQWLQHKEKVLGWLRAAFAFVAIVAIQFNPSRLTRFPLLSYSFLGCFFLYSLVVLLLTRNDKIDSKKIGLATTALDLLWVSLIVFSTGGSATPFFVYYLFPVITASSRYGIKGGVLVALAGVILYGLARFILPGESPLVVDLFMFRTIYLVGLA
jgi:hypothetical protein